MGLSLSFPGDFALDDPATRLEETLDAQRRVAAARGVPEIKRHIFLCCDQTTPKCCDRDRSLAAWEYLKGRLDALSLTGSGGVYRTKANCLRICTGGPVAVVYPEGAWYAHVRPEDIPEIVEEHVVHGRPVQRLLVHRLQPSPELPVQV